MGIFSNIFGGKVKTGSQFKSTYGTDSLRQLLRTAKRRKATTMRNVSYAELALLEKLITKYKDSQWFTER